MPSYDASQFNPPAPVARVTLRNPTTGVAVSDVVLLVDSGADVTLLTRRAIEELEFAPTTGPGYELAGFDGTKSFVQAVIVEMSF